MYHMIMAYKVVKTENLFGLQALVLGHHANPPFIFYFLLYEVCYAFQSQANTSGFGEYSLFADRNYMYIHLRNQQEYC